MQVIYIGNTSISSITTGQEIIFNVEYLVHGGRYTVILDTVTTYDQFYVKCDDKINRWVYKCFFISVDEHRDNLINDIINEKRLSG